MTVVGKKVSSQSKMKAQPGFAIEPVDARKRRGDPGSESELASESARVLHSEAGLLVDRFPSFQLSGDRVPKVAQENESFGLAGVGDVTGGNKACDEFLLTRDGDVRVFVATFSI